MQAALVGVTLLIIGDSHVAFQGSLLSVLPETYEQMGAKVITYGVCSSAPDAWLKGPVDTGCGGTIREGTGPIADPYEAKFPFPDIDTLIKKWDPTAVIVVYGDTIGAYSAETLPTEWVESEIKPLTTAISSKTRCIWVGPTWGSFNPRYGKTEQKTQRISDFLSSHVTPCTYIDSTSLMQSNTVKTVDGLHLTPQSYKAWGADIVDATLPLLEKKGEKN